MTPADFKNERRKLGLTQSELGAILGVGKRQVINMESGFSPIRQAYVTLIKDKARQAQLGTNEKETTE